MDAAVVIAIWLGIVVVSMAIVVYFSRRWGHDPFGWSLLAAVMGPIAVIGMIGARQSERSRATIGGASTADVVMAVDGSAASVEMAREVAAWPSRPTDVVLLAVLPHEARPAVTPTSKEEHDRRVAAMTKEPFAILREANVPARVEVRYGAPGEVIVQYAAECGQALVLVGRRGAGLTTALLGSVSDYVVKNSKRPVMLVG
jgi:nucleotide-binding universal stress UspA family protein